MTRKQLIDTCMKLRPSAKSWREMVERHVDYFTGYCGFDYENWENGQFIEARGIVAAFFEKMARYNLYGHSSPKVRRKVRKIANLMHAIM